MGSLMPDSMVKRVYQCLCSIDQGPAAPAPSGKPSAAAPSGAGRDQLVIFLADSLRGTAEERAPLVMAMSQRGAGPAAVVTCEQVIEVSTNSLFSSTILHFGRKPSFSLFSVHIVLTGPDFCCSSDSGPQRAPAGLEPRENG